MIDCINFTVSLYVISNLTKLLLVARPTAQCNLVYSTEQIPYPLICYKNEVLITINFGSSPLSIMDANKLRNG